MTTELEATQYALAASQTALAAEHERAVRAEATITRLRELRDRASREPLSVDISDYSDEFCAGFLAGQANALDAALAQDAEQESVRAQQFAAALGISGQEAAERMARALSEAEKLPDAEQESA